MRNTRAYCSSQREDLLSTSAPSTGVSISRRNTSISCIENGCSQESFAPHSGSDMQVSCTADLVNNVGGGDNIEGGNNVAATNIGDGEADTRDMLVYCTADLVDTVDGGDNIEGGDNVAATNIGDGEADTSRDMQVSFTADLVDKVGGGDNIEGGDNVAATNTGDAEADTSTDTQEEKGKKRKSRDWDAGRKFKLDWAARYLWFEEEPDPDGGPAKRTRCVPCSWKEKRPHLLQLKVDTIEKHMGKMYVKKTVDGKEQSMVHWKENCKHKRYVKEYEEHIRVQKLNNRGLSIPSMPKLLDRNLRKKIVQFQTVYHILQLGQPMSDFGKYRKFVKLQGNPNFPQSNWSTSRGWEYALAIDRLLKQDLNEIVKNCDFFALSLDEGISKDNFTWICMTVYHAKGHTREADFVGIIKLSQEATTKNVFEIVKEKLFQMFQLSRIEIARKLVCVGVDDSSVMQGCRKGLCIKFQNALAPYMIGIHCMAHKLNLSYQIVDDFECIQHVKTLVENAYAFFSRNPKRLKRFKEMAVGLTKGNKMLKAVARRWISLYSPAKRLFSEYQTLVALMDKLVSTKKEGEKALELFEELIDVETLLTLAGLLPMLREMNTLSKLAQSRTLYICEYATATELACKSLDSLYACTSSMPYNKDNFKSWHQLIEIEGEKSTSCLTYNHRGLLCVKAHSTLVQMHMTKSMRKGGVPCRVNVKRSDLDAIISKVRKNLAAVAQALSKKIEDCFPADELSEAMLIVYPQFWNNVQPVEMVQSEFKRRLHILIKHFSRASVVNGISIDGILDKDALLSQSQCFGTTMWEQVGKFTNEEVTNFGAITKLWTMLGYSQVLREQMSEYFKLVDLCQTMILGSIEDERTFNIMGILKNKVQHKLTKNLDLCIRACAAKYDIEEFPYEHALAIWNSNKERRCHGEEIPVAESPTITGWQA